MATAPRFAPPVSNLRIAAFLAIALLPWLPALRAGLRPDVVVAADGSGDFRTIQQAVAAVPADNHERRIIFVRRGVYHEKVRIDAADVTLRGESRQGTRIEFSQGATEFRAKPDALGIAVLNLNGDDCVIENLTVQNTQGVVGVHAFAIYGRGDRTVIQDCDVLSEGNDTLSLWRTADRARDNPVPTAAGTSPNGRYYQARLKVRGSVDFICPRGWCYMVDSDIYEVNPSAEAAIWHDGSRDPAMKFVLRGCRFDGVEGWQFARHHHDAQFFLLDCTFSAALRDVPPHRVVYPLGGRPATDADRKRNADLDSSNQWGERCYFWNCYRAGGDYAWHRDNLATAPGAPKPDAITAAWTFGGAWDPERRAGPQVREVNVRTDGSIVLSFTESVTVKGTPELALRDGQHARYAAGSGSDTLVFGPGAKVTREDITALLVPGDSAILATLASANIRNAELKLPH